MGVSQVDLFSIVEYSSSQRLFEVIMGLSIIRTKRLRFLLCCEDIKESDLGRYDPASKKLFIATATGPEQRRTYALLGQDILSEFTLLRHGQC